MQEREQHLVLAQHRRFAGLRLLDLDDHLRALEYLGGGINNLRTGFAKSIIVEVDTRTRTSLDHDLMAVGDDLAHGGRNQADPVLVCLDFLRYANKHFDSPAVPGLPSMEYGHPAT